MVALSSEIICPICGHKEAEIMPTDACQYFYDCKGCGEILRPKLGDCCVFCSYGTVKCPPIQQDQSCCSSGQLVLDLMDRPASKVSDNLSQLIVGGFCA